MEGFRRGKAAKSCKSRKKCHWRQDEDELLVQLVQQHGATNWNSIAEHIRGRTGKSCRLRWVNQLDPNVKKVPFDKDEEHKLVQFHQIHGNKWSTISKSFPGRTDNQLKNQYNIMKARFHRQISSFPSTGRSQDEPISSTEKEVSTLKQELISSSSLNLSDLRSDLSGTASTFTLQPSSHPNMSNMLSTTPGSYGVSAPLDYGSASRSSHGRYDELSSEEYTRLTRVRVDCADGFNLGGHDNQGISAELNSALPLRKEDESSNFIDFLGVEKSA